MSKEKTNKQVAENQYYIKTLAEILVLTAKENIVQWGHRESLYSLFGGKDLNNKLKMLNTRVKQYTELNT